jgi:predicted AlkP superfamily pyrophosphatase or phosphodiesterase
MRRLFLLPAFLALSSLSLAQNKAVIVSWDGATHWVVEKMLAEGKLPNLSRMVERGARAQGMRPAFPSKTAVGHASIWTGAWPDVHGVVNNAVPRLNKAEHTFLETISGFSSEAILAEPIYVTAAKAGKRVAVLSSTQSEPPGRHLEALKQAGVDLSRYVSYSGFEYEIAPSRMHDLGERVVPKEAWTELPVGKGPFREITFEVGEQQFFAIIYDDPADPVVGYDTMLIRQGSREARKMAGSSILKPHSAREDINAWSRPFRVTKGELFGNTYFRLFSLTPDASTMELYQRKVSGLGGSADRKEKERYIDAYGGFHDDAFFPYRGGLLGRPLWQGGDGEAERRLMEIVRLDCEFLKRGTRYALKTYRPDLLMHYTPMSDSAGHVWMGVLDPASPAFQPGIAEKLWPFYEQVHVLQDGWLGDILDAVDKNTVVALVSDHGMEGTNKEFNVNAVLERARLLFRTNVNSIEPAQTRIAATPWMDFGLVVNTVDWRHGVVQHGDVEAVVEAAAKALLDARDPENGRQIVTRVFRPKDYPDLGIGGPQGGHLYFELAPGYYPRTRISDRIVQNSPSPIGDGVHGFYPLRTSMQAIFYLAGPGVKQGTIPPMRMIDVAPTLAQLLGIPAPAQSRGRVLREALD